MNRLGTVGIVIGLLLAVVPTPASAAAPGGVAATSTFVAGTDSAVANFSAALQRLVDLVAAAGGAILALVWARVALSWFSTDVTKKVQAKDRARDALVGSLILVAALSGLVWALAQWVLTGR